MTSTTHDKTLSKRLDAHYLQTAEFIVTNSKVNPEIVNDKLILAIDRSVDLNETKERKLVRIKTQLRARKWLDEKYRDLINKKEKKVRKKRKHRKSKKTDEKNKVTNVVKSRRPKKIRQSRILTKVPNPVLSKNIDIYSISPSSPIGQISASKAVIKI